MKKTTAPELGLESSGAGGGEVKPEGELKSSIYQGNRLQLGFERVFYYVFGNYGVNFNPPAIILLFDSRLKGNKLILNITC